MKNHRITINNTLSRKKDVLKPLHNKKINLFVCGPTVYDFSHIGHARTCIFFDNFSRYLKLIGFKVFYLQNITNIDDKIIARAKEKGVPPKDLANVFTEEYLKNMEALKIKSVNKYAKATDYIKEIINQVKRLSDKGFAYKLEDGIYFDISKFNDYGKLSGRTKLQAEDSVSRIDYSKNKKNRGDFCLWKFSRDGEPSWPSPFGEGRPGWHIEDTAITEKFFGPQYDIHGGGLDLIFPHHEAEITQMESISGKKPLAKYWMHTGFLTIANQKMSKSLNNFITINDFLKTHSYKLLRFWIAKNLWNSPIDYSESIMIEVKSSLERIEEFLRRLKTFKNPALKNKILAKLILNTRENFYKNLNDNFNTPKSFAVIFDLIKEVNKFLDKGGPPARRLPVRLPARSAQAGGTQTGARAGKNVIGKRQAMEIYQFFEEVNMIFDIIDFKRLQKSNIPEEVKKLVKEGEGYRKSGNWEKSDKIRAEIAKYGFLVEDKIDGPVLKKL